MAFADWTLIGSPDSLGEAIAHASLASPLAGHGTHCRSALTTGVNTTHDLFGRCLVTTTKDVADSVSTFASAYVRNQLVTSSAAPTSAGVFLHHPDTAPTYDNRGSYGYNLVLRMDADVVTLDLWCNAPPGSGKSGTRHTQLATLVRDKWYRIKLERIYVDASTLRLVCSYADPAVDEDAWTVVHDETLDSTSSFYYPGTQPTMGFQIYNGFNQKRISYLDGWNGGASA